MEITKEMNSISISASMDSHSAGKKSTIMWTKGLRKKFQEAIEKLGIDNAAPKKILELMKVDGLTRDHVSSYLQKYRILLKKMANENSGVQTASKPSLLESSMANYISWNNSSLMLNQEQMNLPYDSRMHTINPQILNISSSCSKFLEDSSSLPIEGYFMQEMENNLDEQPNLIYETTTMDVVGSLNSSNSRLVPNLDGNFLYDCCGFSTEVLPYNNIEMGSSIGVNMNNVLAMSWDQENPINIGNLSNSSFLENSNGSESNYSSPSEFVEMGSLYGSNSNGNLGNGIGEDDLVLTEDDIACLLSYADDNGEYGCAANNMPAILDSPNQVVNGQNIQDIVSYDSYKTEGTPCINHHQNLDGYIPGFDQTFNKQMDEQFIDPIWSLEPLADDITLHGLLVNSYVQDW